MGNSELTRLAGIPPRRFEVGNGLAVDFSVLGDPELRSVAGPAAPPSLTPVKPFHIHPPTTYEIERDHPAYYLTRLIWGFLAFILFLLGASWLWDPFRRLTWENWSYSGKILEYWEEDVAGRMELKP